MSKRRIVFRADGNSQIGLGHVTRSLALADMLKENFSCVFAIQQPSDLIRAQIMEVCEALIELPQSGEYLTEAHELVANQLQPGDIVVLDGYKFDTACQRVFKQAGHKLVCIDDIHAYHFVADAVINHAGGVPNEVYSRENYTELCIGPAFALLRRDFLSAASKPSKEINLQSSFLCMGGADPHNHTIQLMEALAPHKELKEINVLIGASYNHKQALENKAEVLNGRVTIHSNLSASAVRQLMERCGIAICPPSSVAYEYCAVRGLLFLYLTATNQQGIFKYLIEKKAALAFELGEVDLVTNSLKIVDQVVGMQQLILDGLSGDRIKSIFKGLCR